MSTMETEKVQRVRPITAGKLIAVVLILIAVVSFSLADLLELVPVFTPDVNSLYFSMFHEIHELLVLGLVLIVAYLWRPRVGILVGLAYLFFTLPFHLLKQDDLMDTAHLIAVSLTGLLGTWLISRLRNSEERYRSLFTNMDGGLAYCRVIYNGDRVDDLVFLEVNSRFESLTGLRHVIGKGEAELIPDIGESNPELMDVYSRVANGGGTETIECYIPQLRQWYSITVFRPKKGFIVTVFNVITRRKKAEEQLKETFKDLETAQRLTKIGNWKWTIATGEIIWSKGLCLINGWDPDKPTPPFEQLVTFYTPESWNILNEAIVKAINSGEPYDIELETIRTDGTRIIAHTRGEVTLDVNGNATELHGTVQDVTESKRTNEDLIRAKTELSRFFDLVPDMACVLSLDGRFKKINGAWSDALGFNEAEILGMRYTEIMHKDDVRKTTQEVQSHLSQSGKISFISRFRTKRGEYRWFEWNASTAKGDIIVAAARDITVQKENEEALRSSESRYRSLFEQAGDCIIIFEIGESGIPIIVDANKIAATIHGYSIDELKGRPITILEPLLNKDVLERRNAELMANRRTRFEVTHKKKNGNLVILDVESSLLEIGSKTFVLSVEHDITDSKRLEEERIRTDKLKSLGVLAGGIAHDFNNVLASILTNLQITKLYVQRGDRHSAVETLDEAEAASFKARSLTQQLLTFSKGGTPVKRIIHVGELVKQSSTFILSGSKSKPMFEIPDDIWAVEVDEGQVSQVINNIVLNADQAMPDGGIIDIRIANVPPGKLNIPPLSDKMSIEIAIEDHGTGIPRSHFDKLYDPYFTTKQKGSGLGLATAYSIIKNHNGHINCSSELGSGTTFCVYLPASQAKIKKARQTKVAALLHTSLVTRGRVLVMDDETILRNALGRALKECGYEVALASEGAEAVTKYIEAKDAGRCFDAVVLDLTVPGGMGGKEAVIKLREIDPMVKAIVSSGYANDSMISDFREFGFSGVVTKPYKIGDLEKMLSALTRVGK